MNSSYSSYITFLPQCVKVLLACQVGLMLMAFLMSVYTCTWTFWAIKLFCFDTWKLFSSNGWFDVDDLFDVWYKHEIELFELYNFSVPVPERYLAQMVGLMVMAFLMSVFHLLPFGGRVCFVTFALYDFSGWCLVGTRCGSCYCLAGWKFLRSAHLRNRNWSVLMSTVYSNSYLSYITFLPWYLKVI